jgi:hypothetical protein
VCDFGGRRPVEWQRLEPSTDSKQPAKSSVRRSIPATTLESRKVQHGIEAHGWDSQRDKKPPVEANKLTLKNWRPENFGGDIQIPVESGLGASSNHIAPGQEVPHPVGSGSYPLPEQVSYFPSRSMDVAQFKKQVTFGEEPPLYPKLPPDMSSAPRVIRERRGLISHIGMPAPADPNASSSPQASSNSLLRNSPNPWAPDFGWLSANIHVNREKGGEYISHLELRSPANPNASSSPQASSNPLLQNTQNPWVPGFGWLPTQKPVNTNNSYGADYPDYGPPPHVPNAWKRSQGYGKKQFWGRKPENNGKAEADKISFNPIQLMLADRLCVGASIDNTFSIFILLAS